MYRGGRGITKEQKSKSAGDHMNLPNKLVRGAKQTLNYNELMDAENHFFNVLDFEHINFRTCLIHNIAYFENHEKFISCHVTSTRSLRGVPVCTPCALTQSTLSKLYKLYVLFSDTSLNTLNASL